MTIRELEDLEALRKKLIEQVKRELTVKIKNSEPEGVEPIKSESGLKVAVVSISKLKNFSLSPETYIPVAQAEKVEQVMKNTDSVPKLREILEEIVRTGSYYKDYKFQMNDDTIEIIKNFLDTSLNPDAEI